MRILRRSFCWIDDDEMWQMRQLLWLDLEPSRELRDRSPSNPAPTFVWGMLRAQMYATNLCVLVCVKEKGRNLKNIN